MAERRDDDRWGASAEDPFRTTRVGRGHAVGPYRVEREIGHGGRGTVAEALPGSLSEEIHALLEGLIERGPDTARDAIVSNVPSHRRVQGAWTKIGGGEPTEGQA